MNKYHFYLKTNGGEVDHRARDEVEEIGVATGSRRNGSCRRMIEGEEDIGPIPQCQRMEESETFEQGRNNQIPPAPEQQDLRGHNSRE